MPRINKISLITLAAAALALTACHTPSGRVGVNDTTAAEVASSEVLPTALIEFSDQAPRQLVADLQQIKPIEDAQGPVTIILGDINNKTGNTSSTDFQVAMARMRNNLINSTMANSKLHFVESRARMEQLAQKENVQSQTGIVGPPAYNPKTTYTLIGDFYRIHRGDTNEYYMQFQLVNFATNQIVFSNRYDVKQVVEK